MKTVLAIFVNGKFKQYLLKSEVRYIVKMCEDFTEVTVKTETMPKEKYKLMFGK